jgi:acyl carrier protein
VTYQIEIADDEIIPENMDSLESLEKYLCSKMTFRPV